MSAPAPDRIAWTAAELAEALGCTRQHIQNLISRGEIHSVKLGRRRFIPRAVVDALLSGGADDAAS